jgi:hypothetical protein
MPKYGNYQTLYIRSNHQIEKILRRSEKFIWLIRKTRQERSATLANEHAASWPFFIHVVIFPNDVEGYT